MLSKVGSDIRITDPSDELLKWCKGNLVLNNPDYQKKARMHLWLGNTPREITLYAINGKELVLPFGCLREVLPMLSGDLVTTYRTPAKVDFGGTVPLYDYQKEALKALIASHYGILRSPAGSGKTQIGIALAENLGVKTLWLTHTRDLLSQSKHRAEMYIDPGKLGTITEGTVSIGESMTFATIQTMCKLDLDAYKHTWDCVIVDECHRVSGTPTAVTQFSKVLNSLSARHKYGLSATVHRADGLIKATYAMLGNVVYNVPDEAVKSKVMTVNIKPIGTRIGLDTDFLNPDGTINYAKMITYLVQQEGRNQLIVDNLVDNSDHYNLVLSERVDHLKTLYSMLPGYLQKQASVIDGKMTSKKRKAEREQAIEDMRTGKKRYLFATYSLAKEGLDIPRLDRLHMVTPQKDYAVIVQSVGRVARTFEGKSQPWVYDYVDQMINLMKAYKKRCSHYRKCGCKIIEGD